ncbi:MAG: YidB family protein [Pseudomonadota bacterium]
MQLGTQLLSDQLGSGANGESITSAISNLMGDGQGGLDITGLVSQMNSNGDLAGIVNSWLGDGSNTPISAETLQGLFGADKMQQFATQLGTDSGSAANSLAEVLPKMIDSGSSGGSLLDSAGGVEGLLGAAKSLLS